MNKIYTPVKNMTSQQESVIVGMDVYSPAITVPYKSVQKSNKSKKVLDK